MKTQTQTEIDNERDEKARQAPPAEQPDELQASDFFPPGEGWNQADGEGGAVEGQDNPSDADSKRH